jgi:TRAP-type C4-dicarboxylate transport system substrate-binding protein
MKQQFNPRATQRTLGVHPSGCRSAGDTLKRGHRTLRALSLVACCLLLAAFAPRALAADVELKVATVAPPGTSFHKHLEDLGAQWQKAPGTRVTLDIFPGTQGGEPQIVRRMRVNQLQGAMLTAVGLSQIDESVTALQLMPMTFNSWAEVDHVRARLEPKLEKIFAAKGYVVLFWGDAGWVRFFSKKPITSLGDLKQMRVFASSGTPKALELLKDYYNPVVLEPEKILLSLSNGTIDAIPIPPFLANTVQVATEAKHMLDMRWTPVVGAMVVNKRAWDQLPAETRKHLADTARATGEKIRADSRREDEEAIAAMKAKQGLQVTALSPAAEKGWREAAEKSHPRIRGPIVPADVFDEVTKALKEFRAK